MKTTKSNTINLGTYSINSWKGSLPKGSFSLDEVKRTLEDIEIPQILFDRDTFPNAKLETFGEYIPVLYGKCRGVRAYNIDKRLLHGRFKFANHPVKSVEEIRYEDGSIPDIDLLTDVDLDNATFDINIYLSSKDFYVDCTSFYENPVDALEQLLINETMGADFDSSLLYYPTSLEPRGFGEFGARNIYVQGYDSQTGEEQTTTPISLILTEPTSVSDIVKTISADTFMTVYVDKNGLYQVTPFNASTSEGLSIIDINKIIGKPTVNRTKIDPVTTTTVRYNVDGQLDDSSSYTYVDNKSRIKRGLSKHSIQDSDVIITSRFGAQEYAERNTVLKSGPIYSISLKTTQEFMLKEIGEHVRVIYEPLNLNEVMEIIEIVIHPGSFNVSMKLSNNRGTNDGTGFWVDDIVNFPSSLGGALITAWDYTWTDEQKQWAIENVGFWCDDSGYIDSVNDPSGTYNRSLWF